MEFHEPARRLTHLGRFKDALQALDQSKAFGANRRDHEVLRSEILERVGRSGEAFAAATALLGSKQLGYPTRVGAKR